MNRLHDVRRTLPKNLKDNQDYPNAEFVLLDYGSTDGLGEWVRSEMMCWIESGRLNYYRTEEEYFRPNHSQNVSFNLAQNELVANVDADNFTHKGYLHRLNQCAASPHKSILIVPENFLRVGSDRMFLKGRFALYKKDILMLRGFDEDLDEGFGDDDVNFVIRALMARFMIVRFESHFTEGRLFTTDEERVSFVKNKNFESITRRNRELTMQKVARGIISVNPNRSWGKAKLQKNFKETVST